MKLALVVMTIVLVMEAVQCVLMADVITRVPFAFRVVITGVGILVLAVVVVDKENTCPTKRTGLCVVKSCILIFLSTCIVMLESYTSQTFR